MTEVDIDLNRTHILSSQQGPARKKNSQSFVCGLFFTEWRYRFWLSCFKSWWSGWAGYGRPSCCNCLWQPYRLVRRVSVCLPACLSVAVHHKTLHARETNEARRWAFPIRHKEQYTSSAPVSIYCVGEINFLLSLKPDKSCWILSKHIFFADAYRCVKFNRLC